MINRRKFLLDVCKWGGIAALFKLGVPFAEAQMLQSIVTGQSSALSCTQDYVSTATPDGGMAVARYTANDYTGLVYTPDSDESICGVDFQIYIITGDISAINYYCQIWTLDDSTPKKLASLLGTSAALSGADLDSAGNHKFFSETDAGIALFGTPVDISSGVPYGITVATAPSGSPPSNSSNYWTLGRETGGGVGDGINGGAAQWTYGASLPYEAVGIEAANGIAVKISRMI